MSAEIKEETTGEGESFAEMIAYAKERCVDLEISFPPFPPIPVPGWAMRNYTTLAIWAENDQATSLQIYATLAGLRFELAEHVNGKRVEINVGQKGLRQLRAFIDAHLESVRPER